MTIQLQTGLPGACKTLYTLDRVEKLRRKTGRPVFYNGIPIFKDKLPDWQEFGNPADWHKCPPESIVILDEAQRLFRPRANGSTVPEYEAKLETHRHGGIDLIVMTQRPRLLSVNVRELVGLHYHAHRTFGLERSKIYRWSECHMNTQNRTNADEEFTYRFNREVFTWYKSAEAHTVTANIPPKVWMLLAICVLLPVLIGWTWWKLQHKTVEVESSTVQNMSALDPMGGVGQVGRRGPMTSAEYIVNQQPRVPGLAYTAPAFDRVTEPKHAPYPAACAMSKDRCQCYTQQATKLDMSQDLCKSIVRDGFFMAWDEKTQQREAPAQPLQRSLDSAPVVQAGSGLGGFNTTRVVSAEPVSTVNPPVQQDQQQGRGRAIAR